LVRRGACALAACLLVCGLSVFAQQKTAKQAENLKKSADAAEQSLADVVDQVKNMLASYNDIVDGKSKNVESDYKKLANDLKSTQKKIQNANKSVNSLDKQAQSFFDQWQKELSEYSSDSMREKSSARLDDAKQKYQALGQTLGEASKAFQPLMQNLNDQVLYLGRDLSPEAIADLKDEAADLNKQAEDVTGQIKQMLAKADEQDAVLEAPTDE
jgi:chromosome segregation ATPase